MSRSELIRDGVRCRLSDEAAEIGRITYPLFEKRPSRLAVGQYVVALVEQLEARSGIQLGVVGADRKRREQVPEGFDRSDHQCQRRAGERGELGRSEERRG